MMGELSIGGLAISFAGGLVAGLNPCCYSAVPGALGYLGGFSQPSVRQCAWLSFWIALGTFSANMFLGGLAIFAGRTFGAVPAIRYCLAVVPILMGLVVLHVIPLHLPGLRLPGVAGPSRKALGSYAVGLALSLAVLPCATPILASILSFASLQGKTLTSMGLLASYGAGLAMPVFLAGAFVATLSKLRSVSRFWPYVSQVSGVLLIILGLYLLWKV